MDGEEAFLSKQNYKNIIIKSWFKEWNILQRWWSKNFLMGLQNFDWSFTIQADGIVSCYEREREYNNTNKSLKKEEDWIKKKSWESPHQVVDN